MNLASISRSCNFQIVENSFTSKVLELGCSSPEAMNVSADIVDGIQARLRLTINTMSLRLEAGRRCLVNDVLQPILAQFPELLCFPEQKCTSALFLKQGPVDYLIGSHVPLFKSLLNKVFVVECEAVLVDDFDHFPQLLGQLSAVMNGGDFSQGALTDGCVWRLALLTRDDPKASSTVSSSMLPTKPKLTLSLSPPLEVVGRDKQISLVGLRLLCQHLYVCFGDCYRKMMSSHLLQPQPLLENSDLADISAEFAAMSIPADGHAESPSPLSSPNEIVPTLVDRKDQMAVAEVNLPLVPRP